MADLDKIVKEEREDGEKLREELSACKHFLMDTVKENERHKIFNFQMPNLNAKIINEVFEQAFNTLESATKFDIAMRYVLRNVETVEYRYYYAH